MIPRPNSIIATIDKGCIFTQKAGDLSVRDFVNAIRVIDAMLPL
jgi:hypothetical protein